MESKICFTSVDVEDGGAEKLGQILDIFKKYSVRATLFVTGEVLEKCADLIKEWGISYEIASHSFTHRFWPNLSLPEREEELDKFIVLYQKIFQKKPLGFRAPSHLIDRAALELLDKKGFLYDSSVLPHYVPFKKYRGYQGRKSLLPYYPAGLNILEIPVSGQAFGVPLAGAWISKLPLWIYRALFLVYRPNFLTLNMHSWEALDSRFIKKLEDILKILEKNNYIFFDGEQIFENREQK